MKTSPTTLKIVEEENVVDENFFDLIGRDFNWNHEKGLAEWLKNSADAYLREEVADKDQFVILRLRDAVGENPPSIECIDFVGMSELDIDKAFKRWGDPEAARRGLNARVYGGHGNGGKFYMRQMFQRSHFITYRDGRLSVFGFNEKRRYGFAEGLRNKKVSASKALEIAGLDAVDIPTDIKKAIHESRQGFTVVRGERPRGMKRSAKFDVTVRKLRNHPQVRRIIDHINVWAIHNNEKPYTILKPDTITPMVDFEKPRVVELPEKMSIEGKGNKPIIMSSKKYPAGRLVLRTSAEAFTKGSGIAELNSIDIIGELGVIASYPMTELSVKTFPQASFIYGECVCPILEDPDVPLVKNDRSRLVDHVRSSVLLAWIAEQVDEYAQEIAQKEQKEQEAERLRVSTAYNDYLNRWSDKFMRRIMGEIVGGGRGRLGRRHEAQRS